MSAHLKAFMLAPVVFALMIVTHPAIAHEDDASPATKTLSEKAADANDVASIDAIVSAVYDVISGPAGPRDWARMRSLFVPGGRLMVRNTQAPDGLTTMTLGDYENRAAPAFMKDGFFERGIHNEIMRYDGIANVFSTYESRHAADDAEPFARGINSIQVLQHDGRWWIVSIYWQSETSDAPIPARFLP